MYVGLHPLRHAWARSAPLDAVLPSRFKSRIQVVKQASLKIERVAQYSRSEAFASKITGRQRFGNPARERAGRKVSHYNVCVRDSSAPDQFRMIARLVEVNRFWTVISPHIEPGGFEPSDQGLTARLANMVNNQARLINSLKRSC